MDRQLTISNLQKQIAEAETYLDALRETLRRILQEGGQ